MIHLLLYILFGLAIFGYILCGKDFFAPGVILALAFIFATACAIYNQPLWKFEISFFTLSVIVSSVFVAIIINGFVHSIYQRVTIHKKVENLSQINTNFSLFCVFMLILLVGIMLLQVFRVGGTGSFEQVMLNFRAKNAYSTDLSAQLPGWVRQLLNLASVLCNIYIFNLIAFGKKLKRIDIFLNILIIVLCIVSSLLTGGRFSAMTMLIAAFVMWYLIKKEDHRSLKFMAVVKITLIGLISLYGFYAVKSFVGRETDLAMIDYITHYAGGGIPGLDLYFKNPPLSSDIWGKETFYSLNNGLRKLGILDIPYYYIHHEFRISGGVSIGNIYTAFRDYHYDFGMLGLYFLHMLFSLFFSVFYEHEKKRKSGIGIILLSMMFYCVVFYTVSNVFFANIISFGFVIKLVLLLVFYQILLRKKIVIRLR